MMLLLLLQPSLIKTLSQSKADGFADFLRSDYYDSALLGEIDAKPLNNIPLSQYAEEHNT